VEPEVACKSARAACGNGAGGEEDLKEDEERIIGGGGIDDDCVVAGCTGSERGAVNPGGAALSQTRTLR
jgi:hypothetical protein